MLSAKLIGFAAIVVGAIILSTTSQGFGIAIENIWDWIAIVVIALGSYILAKG